MKAGLIRHKNILFTIRMLNFSFFFETLLSFCLPVFPLQTLRPLNKYLSFISSQNFQNLFEFVQQSKLQLYANTCALILSD